MLTRIGYNRFRLANTEFVGKVLDGESTAVCFEVGKPATAMMRYHSLRHLLHFARVVVLTHDDGGSTALVCLVGSPAQLISVSSTARHPEALEEFIELRGLQDRVEVYHAVDEGDVARLDEITRTSAGDDGIDVVVDSMSRRLESAHRSFQTLFPRVRPGGHYLFEGWAFGRQIFYDSHAKGTLPQIDWKTRAESQIATMGKPVEVILEPLLSTQQIRPDVISRLVVSENWIDVQRGHASIDAGFALVSDRPGGMDDAGQ